MRGRDLAAAAAVALGVLALGNAILLDRRTSDRAVRSLPKVAAPANREAFDERSSAVIARSISMRPLDQQRLNALYVAAIAAGNGGLADRVAPVLGELGWRYTATQQNLIYRAAMRSRFDEVFERAEALLRRDSLAQETLALLYALELAPQFRAVLAQRLVERPIWRSDFLTGRRGFANPRKFAARRDTLARMARLGGRPSRGELGPFVGALVDAGRFADAYAVWRTTVIGPLPARGLFDPRFERAAEMRDVDDQSAMPFDWRFENGREANADASRTSGSSELAIRWTGLGVPILARQRFRTVPGAHALRVTGPDARADLIAEFDFRTLCPGSESVFDQVTRDRGGTLILSAGSPIRCQFPEFRLAGKVGDIPRRVDAVLTSIQIAPIG